MARVLVFIDGSNLYHSLRQAYKRTDVDFIKFCDRLANGRDLVRAYYYNAAVNQQVEPQRYADQLRFFDRLRRVPKFEVKLGTLVYRNFPPSATLREGHRRSTCNGHANTCLPGEL